MIKTWQIKRSINAAERMAHRPSWPITGTIASTKFGFCVAGFRFAKVKHLKQLFICYQAAKVAQFKTTEASN